MTAEIAHNFHPVAAVSDNSSHDLAEHVRYVTYSDKCAHYITDQITNICYCCLLFASSSIHELFTTVASQWRQINEPSSLHTHRLAQKSLDSAFSTFLYFQMPFPPLCVYKYGTVWSHSNLCIPRLLPLSVIFVPLCVFVYVRACLHILLHSMALNREGRGLVPGQSVGSLRCSICTGTGNKPAISELASSFVIVVLTSWPTVLRLFRLQWRTDTVTPLCVFLECVLYTITRFGQVSQLEIGDIPW